MTSTCLRFCEAQMEALAQVLDTARASLEGWAATALHHLHQQNDAVCMLAASQEALYTQHLHSGTRYFKLILSNSHLQTTLLRYCLQLDSIKRTTYSA